MKIIQSIESLNEYTNQTYPQEIGFVPTMGALHLGHVSLIAQSIKENSITVVSIFINPTQFDQKNDLTHYPKETDKDLDKLRNLGIDAVFLPKYNEIYHDNYNFRIHENQLSNQYCGAHRKGHFDGVLTVVMKLFNLVKPTRAYFGEKDYQQLSLIKNMVAAFFLDLEIVSCPTIRENDGLAMSSRNSRLATEQRNIAAGLYKTISSGLDINEIKERLTHLGFKIEYIEVLDNRLLVAAKLGNIRLIDNIQIKSNKENK
ncbi:MAG: pantoate--beta-alanine ligase [Marinicellaceae bacterium]